VDAATGTATVLVPAGTLRDAAGRPIVVEEVQLSPDERRALVFSNSVPVWRTNTRGTYHLVELATGRVTPLVTVTTPGRPVAAAATPPAPRRTRRARRR
jgi:dipeptidyl-peptidase-4